MPKIQVYNSLSNAFSLTLQKTNENVHLAAMVEIIEL